MCFSENSAASNDPVQTGECARDEKLDGLIAYKLFLHGFTQITAMMYADETMVTPNKFLFPENSNRAGIHRESQPAQPYRAVRQERSFTRRQAMELDRMGSSIIYPGKDISSAVIRVHRRLSAVKRIIDVSLPL